MCGSDIETKAQSSQWKAVYYDWEDKENIEIESVDDAKKRVLKVFL